MRGSFNNIGGLVGDGGGATITSSSATATVRASTGDNVGGLVGGGTSATIIASYAAAMVSGRNVIGGLVGAGNSARIIASYATGTVSGAGSAIGGLVGTGIQATIITASYAAGTVSGPSDVGGLVGFVNGPRPTITASYWDRDLSGRESGAFGEPLSTVELQFPLAELQTAWEDQLCPGSTQQPAWDFGESYQYPALTCPPGGAAAQEAQRTLPAFVRFSPADISNLTLSFLTVDGANLTATGVSAARDGEELHLIANLSCAGSAPCMPAQVDYYVSADALINATDTLVGTDFAPFARGGGTTLSVTNVSMNAQDGTVRYYGACVGDVCTAGTELFLQTDPQVTAVRLEEPALQSGDMVNLAVNLSCPGVCLNSFLSLYASGDAFLDLTDELINEQEFTLGFEENRTVTRSFRLTYSAYYGFCTATECFGDSVVRIVINNPNDLDDADGVVNTTDVDDDGDGLIEIATVDELNNIRYVVDGSGYQAGASAPKNVTGCPPPGCIGYELTAAMDLSPYGRGYDDGKGWQPVGDSADPFTAIFDGNDFLMSYLYINRPTTNQVGFFGALGGRAQVRSVSLAAIEVTGSDDVGGLVGDGTGARITASSAAGTLNGELRVGGLLGSARNAIITSSSAAGTVSGLTDVGGLVGDGERATVTASYAAATVSGTLPQVGGLIGDATRATITSSYAAGTVTGQNGVGGLIGIGRGTTITSSYAAGMVTGFNFVGGLAGLREDAVAVASYWDTNVSGITSGLGSPQTTAALQSPIRATGIYATWSGLCPNDPSLAIWDFGTARHYPLLQCTPGGVAAQLMDLDRDGIVNERDLDDDGNGLIEIETADELNNIRYVLDGSGYQESATAAKDTTGCPADGGCKGYELTTDIDLTAYGEDYDGGKGWAPIGSFNAILDGNGFAVRNLYINRTNQNNVAFFGSISGGARGTIRSIAFEDAEVIGKESVGVLIGLMNRNSWGRIIASSVTGSAKGATSGNFAGVGLFRRGDLVSFKLWNLILLCAGNGNRRG